MSVVIVALPKWHVIYTWKRKKHLEILAFPTRNIILDFVDLNEM